MTVTQTHNGTDFFYSDGAAGTAEYKVRLSVKEWQKKTGVKKVKILGIPKLDDANDAGVF